MNLYREFSEGLSFDAYLAGVSEQRQFWMDMAGRATVPDDLLQRATTLCPATRLLVLLEDWCGDASSTVPVIAKLAASVPQLELRILHRDAYPMLMDAHLTGSSRSIPVVMALDARYEEIGWWGPRPKRLQEWFVAEGRTMPSIERYREIRRWYAVDRGRSTISEILDVLGCAPHRMAA